MRLITPISLSLILVATSVATGDVSAQTPRSIVRRMQADSTEFSLTVPKHSLRAGESFVAKVHMDVKPTWRIFSIKSNTWDTLPPLRVQLPDSLLPDYEIT